MSFRSIELQFALHRNSDAGLAQNQLQNRPVLDQQQLAEQSVKLAEDQRRKSGKTDESAFAHIKNGQDSRNKDNHGSGGDNKRKDSEASSDMNTQPNQAKHPYKGRHIDLSL